MSTRALITILFALSLMVSLSYGGMSCFVPEGECSDFLSSNKFLCCHNTTGFEYCCTPWKFGSVLTKQYPFLMIAGILSPVLMLLCFICRCLCRCVGV